MGMKLAGYESWLTGLRYESAVNEELAWAEQVSTAKAILRRAKAKVHQVDGTMEAALDMEITGTRTILVGILHDLERLGSKRDEETTFKYAVPLEFGHVLGGFMTKDGKTGWVEARPFMRPAIEEVLAELEGSAVAV